MSNDNNEIAASIRTAVDELNHALNLAADAGLSVRLEQVDITTLADAARRIFITPVVEEVKRI